MIELTLRQLLNSMSLCALYRFALETAAKVDSGGCGRLLIEKIFDAIKARPVPVLENVPSASPAVLPPAPISRPLALRMIFFAVAAAIAVGATLLVKSN